MHRISLVVLALTGFIAHAEANEPLKSAELAARGLARGVQEATLSSELPARIIRLPLKDGDAFKQGDLLVEFDCERPKAEWKAAEAERLGTMAAYDNSRRLVEYRAAGAHDVQLARAALEKATATVEVIAVRLKQCRIFAPFDGRLVDLAVREHEMPQAGQPLMRVVTDTRLEVDMIVPAKWLAWLKPGETFSFTPEESTLKVSGSVSRIGGAIDPISQTIRAVGTLKTGSAVILPGQGGLIQFLRPGS
jgi:membrane fusion protein, multidrug efflux system